MHPKKTSYAPILTLLETQQPLSAHQLSQSLGLSRQMVHKYLKYLIQEVRILKHGKAPHVFYTLATNTEKIKTIPFSFGVQQHLNQRFLQFDVDGKRLSGAEGFMQRCEQRNLDTHRQSELFLEHINNVNKLRDQWGLIDAGYDKFCKQVKESHLDNLLYCDVYQIAQFGRSKLGNLAFYAKQSQSHSLYQELIHMTKSQVQGLVSTGNFDAVCFVPHSLRRNIQLMDVLQKNRNIDLPRISLQKLYTGDVIIPQKSLKGADQRIRNAQQTIFYSGGKKNIKHLLLIDDFVGSGATLNISAQKIKQAQGAQKITGLALVGNVDMTYEVINEI